MKWLKSYPFWICVVFAALLWFFLYLSNTVELKLKLRVEYSELPENFIVAKTSTKTIPVSFFVKGNEVNKTKEAIDNLYVDIDLSFIKVNDTVDVIETVYSPAVFAKQQIDANLKSNPNYTITIDSVYITLEKSLTKKVPIKNDYDYVVPKSYILSANSGFSTDSVEIIGLVNTINPIDYIYIGKRNLGIITSPTTVDIDLSKLYPEITVLPETISLVIDVQLATQGEIVLDLNSDLNYNSLKFFPNFVTIKYSTAVADYDNITADSFEIEIDTTMSTENKAIVYLKKNPESIKIISIEPNFVEYYIFEE